MVNISHSYSFHLFEIFRWEEEKYTDGRKWTTLEHKGPLFPPPYDSLPHNVKFFYNGTEVKLKDPAEEIMTFYARMLDHDYTSKEVFNTNFLTDWRKSMTQAERELIKDIRKCDFTQVANYFKEQTEQRKAMSKEDKKKLKDDNEKIRKEYGYCMWDKHRQPVGNYKIEPPGLFRGRGEHPKMGCVKKRIRPEDVIINIGREGQIPKPPEGHHWKEVRHDNKVSWLVMWTENIRGNNKYIMLNASSRVKV
jgi:DNA topoisomerase-1